VLFQGLRERLRKNARPRVVERGVGG